MRRRSCGLLTLSTVPYDAIWHWTSHLTLSRISLYLYRWHPTLCDRWPSTQGLMSRLHPLMLLPIDVILLLLPRPPQPQQWAKRDNNHPNLIILHPYCSPFCIFTPLRSCLRSRSVSSHLYLFGFCEQKIKLSFNLNFYPNNLILQRMRPRSQGRWGEVWRHALFLQLSGSTHLWKLYY